MAIEDQEDGYINQQLDDYDEIRESVIEYKMEASNAEPEARNTEEVYDELEEPVEKRLHGEYTDLQNQPQRYQNIP